MFTEIYNMKVNVKAWYPEVYLDYKTLFSNLDVIEVKRTSEITHENIEIEKTY